jgi:phosphohistidine phosphatase
MMKLYFMRHGIAADRDDTDDDAKRALTAKGVKRMQKAARGVKSLALTFDRILTSPYERARQTARIIGQVLKLDESVEEIDALCPGHSAQELLSVLGAYADTKNILLVGHEPLLSEAVSFLLSSETGVEIRLKKGGLCCLKVNDVPPRQSAELDWMLTPKQLRLLAR